jgi:hypothetical protein
VIDSQMGAKSLRLSGVSALRWTCTSSARAEACLRYGTAVPSQDRLARGVVEERADDAQALGPGELASGVSAARTAAELHAAEGAGFWGVPTIRVPIWR